MSDCLVCGKSDTDRPTIFRNLKWCSDDHRKELLSRGIVEEKQEDLDR